jgi:hypothetical protein
MKIPSYVLVLLIMMVAQIARADDFFDIESVSFHREPQSDGPQIIKKEPKIGSDNKPILDNNNRPIIQDVNVPYMEARVCVKDQIKTDTAIAKVYFYDQDKKLIGSVDTPNQEQWPVFIPKDKKQSIYFIVPDNVLSQENWSAVVVFGDRQGVDANLYGSDGLDSYDYAEKGILEDKNGLPIERKPAMDPLIEHVVQTGNPAQPQITIFLRPPLGMTDASQAQGVLCLSLLAGSLDGVKAQLQGNNVGQSLGGILQFAQDHKLIIICWGSRGLWDPRKSWDDLSTDSAWDTDKSFDQVAEAWTNGVQYFIKQYGIPSSGYLLWGMSGSAQYACRLALRKPEYFLAIHAHIPSSFDKPTPEGSRILWCLTTGEKESGYERSLRFYAQCRALGYPMVYKAIVGLGHAESPISDNLGLKFFEYALTARQKRATYDEALNNPLTAYDSTQTNGQPLLPWLDSFRKPAFVGDAVNQGIFPYDQRDMVPLGFQVALPTKEIAEAWNH